MNYRGVNHGSKKDETISNKSLIPGFPIGSEELRKAIGAGGAEGGNAIATGGAEGRKALSTLGFSERGNASSVWQITEAGKRIAD